MNDEYVENEFDKFMKGIGFSRVSEDVGDSPEFQNADYVDKLNKIVVELKVLQKEFFAHGGIIGSLNTIVINPVNINQDGTGQYEFTMPEMNRSGGYNSFREPLERVIKKANRQLRETREYYFKNDTSFGLVILVQVGFNQISPEVTARLVQKSLHHSFSSVDGVMICVPCSQSWNSVTLQTNPQCVSVTNETDEVKKNWCIRLANEWIGFLESGGHLSK